MPMMAIPVSRLIVFFVSMVRSYIVYSRIQRTKWVLILDLLENEAIQ